MAVFFAARSNLPRVIAISGVARLGNVPLSLDQSLTPIDLDGGSPGWKSLAKHPVVIYPRLLYIMTIVNSG